ncbi:hypothetical protein [Bradyrhizobium japonicum]|uniref:hypothetical protein n=1 Tax=Bradyrhizobium japonicum TaxID=375 RepID=UPI0034E450F0
MNHDGISGRRHDEPDVQRATAVFRRWGGRRVLIGLTPEETFEFERLDSEQAQVAPDAGERRRLELYEKHEGAWRAWMAQSRTERREGFNLY